MYYYFFHPSSFSSTAITYLVLSAYLLADKKQIRAKRLEYSIDNNVSVGNAIHEVIDVQIKEVKERFKKLLS